MTTTYFLNLIMGNVFGSQTDPAIPGKYYVGLSSTTPAADGTNITEPSGGGYARAEITSFTAPENGVVSNQASIDFAAATDSWGDALTHYVLFDESDHALLFDALQKSRTIEADTQFYFQPNALTFTLRSAT